MSTKVSDKTHSLTLKFGEYMTYKSSLYHWKRRWLYPFTLLAGFFFGYVVICHGFQTNIYEIGYCQTIFQPFDISSELMREWAKKDHVKYMAAHRQRVFNMIENDGNAPAID